VFRIDHHDNSFYNRNKGDQDDTVWIQSQSQLQHNDTGGDRESDRHVRQDRHSNQQRREATWAAVDIVGVEKNKIIRTSP